MNLAIDIGNTRVKLGLFEGETLLRQEVASHASVDTVQAFCNLNSLNGVILSSVAGDYPDLRGILPSHTHLLLLDHQTPLPFTNRYTTPHTLGKDRLAAISGAHSLYPRQNNLVIDLGTCIKYDFVDSGDAYLGGNISPGARMRSKAMHTFTARLPEVSMDFPAHFIGNSTESALQNGAYLGALLEMKGFIEYFRENRSQLNVLVTGGDAAFFTPRLHTFGAQHMPHLTLIGLNHILNFNITTSAQTTT